MIKMVGLIFNYLIDYEESCIKLRHELEWRESYIIQLEEKQRSLQESQISQINNLNKERIKSDRKTEEVQNQLKNALEENKEIISRFEKQIEEIERMNEYIFELEQKTKISENVIIHNINI